VFETFAVTGAKPNDSSTGKLISVPEPTTLLTVPAATPAAMIARTSKTLKRADLRDVVVAPLGSLLARQARAGIRVRDNRRAIL
jgi:hypothetical protein